MKTVIATLLMLSAAIKTSRGESNRVVVAVRDAASDSIGMASEVVKF